MPHTRVTITHFLIDEQRRYGGTGHFTTLVNDIVTACKMISHQVNRGSLAGNLGLAGSENVQGETQKTLDVVTNEIFLHLNALGGNYAGMASEEIDDVHVVSQEGSGKYLLLFDPLDGSSNIDVNIAVGTIFSVLRCPAGIETPSAAQFLQKGAQQVAAGYILYGAYTMLVLSTGHGVKGFTLDQDIGEFVLTNPDRRVPADTNEYAINASRSELWEPPIQRYIKECQAGKNGPRGKSFNMRWVGSMVADVHRILCRGGVFLYPIDSGNRDKGGKLRLLYEASPMAYIVEQAGGIGTTCRGRILDLTPTSLHQRCAVVLGSRNEVERIESYYREHG
ncbi:MAG: class 1 fructose-bisphosphatase [Alphaproteobacteria bacterium]|nr:class 1 fructose-bisphosphatase [Alphaproteobacteria bacterium]